MSRPNFIDARMAYIEERARSGGNPPTREELAAFYDGWHASQSLSPEEGRTLAERNAAVQVLTEIRGALPPWLGEYKRITAFLASLEPQREEVK